MKRFLIKFALVIAPVLVLVAGVNISKDTANRFGASYEQALASELAAGHSMTGVRNYKERLLQKLLIAEKGECPEVMVLGSSRSMHLDSAYFPGRSFMNHALSNATLEDHQAILEMRLAKGCMPKHLVLGLDYLSLGAHSENLMYPTLFLESRRFQRRILGQADAGDPFSDVMLHWLYTLGSQSDVFSPSYFKINATHLLTPNEKPVRTEIRENKDFTRLSDGSISYDLESRQASAQVVDERVKNFVESELRKALEAPLILDDVKAAFESMLDFLLQNGCTVDILLPPYHPVVYKELQEGKPGMLESEKVIRDIAARKKILVKGSFDPASLGLDEGDFLDGQHALAEAMHVMMR